MSASEIYFHGFSTIRVNRGGTVPDRGFASLEFVNDKGESIELTVFGPIGKITALEHCIKAEFDPQGNTEEGL